MLQMATSLIGILVVGLLIGLGVVGVVLVIHSLKNIFSKSVSYDYRNEVKKTPTGKLDPMYEQSRIKFPVDAQSSEPNPRFSGDSE